MIESQMRSHFVARVVLVLSAALAAFIVFPAAAATQRPMTFDDILSQREFSEVRIRDDAKAVAFIVRYARVDKDDYAAALYVRDLEGTGVDRALSEGEGIRNVRWKPRSRELSYWDEAASRLVIVDPRIGEPRGLELATLGLEVAPSTFEWSPDGTRFAALVPRAQEEPSTPYLYQDLHYRTSTSPIREPRHELAVFSADGSTVCRSGAADWSRARRLAWAPSGSAVALMAYRLDERAGSTEYDTMLVGTDDCTPVRRIRDRSFVDFGGSDTDLVSIVTKSNLRADGGFGFSTHASAIVRETTAGEKAAESMRVQLEATQADSDERVSAESVFVHRHGIIAEAGDRISHSLFRVEKGALRRIDNSDKRISGCSLAGASPTAACVIESVTEAPEIGLVDLRKGSVVKLTTFNAQMGAIRLGKVERVRVPDDRGRLVTMYLVYPTGYRQGQRYPALVVMYGFDNSFVSQAQYITSYAPQVYASRGYVTLLWNYPPPMGGAADDLAAQARDFQLGPFATTKNAVSMLIERGLADPARIGIAGHSMGSHWGDYAITHSELFAASSSHAPGGYSPSYYWRSGGYWRRRMDRIFGGPPVGGTLAAWQALSPPLFVAPKIPQLREVPDSEINGEFDYRRWKDSGAPVEMVVYPNETHVFHRPQGRRHSLELNMDWFDFWLRGVENGDAAKVEQYERWRAMRHEQCEGVRGDDAPWYCSSMDASSGPLG